VGTSSPARTQVSWGGNRSLSKQLRAPSRGGMPQVARRGNRSPL